MQNKTKRLWGLMLALIVLMISVFCISAAAAEATTETTGTTPPETVVGETTYYLTEVESAQEYVDAYADNLSADPNFEEHRSRRYSSLRFLLATSPPRACHCVGTHHQRSVFFFVPGDFGRGPYLLQL